MADQFAGNVIANKPLGDISIGAAIGAALVNPVARALGTAAAIGARATHPRSVAAFTSGAITGIGETGGNNLIGNAQASQRAGFNGKW